jgi:GAF domain-containing protein
MPATEPNSSLSGAMAAVSRFVVAEATLGETLQRIAELAVQAIDSAAGAGLTLLEGRIRPVTVFASNAGLSAKVDQAQYDEDAGPCLEAYRRPSIIRVGDIAAVADQWPGYTKAAGERGVGSTLSVPLVAGDRVYGALNLYATAKFAFHEADIDTAQQFASQASIVVANSSAYWDARDLANGLTEAMKTRAVIEQAKGKLMATGRYDAEQAFEVLIQASQRSNLRLHDVADRIVNNVALPAQNAEP